MTKIESTFSKKVAGVEKGSTVAVMPETKAEIKSEVKESSLFRTKDLNQAAFMWSQPEADLEDIDAQQGKGGGITLYFKFRLALPEEDVGKLIMDYANGKTRVEPLAFANNQNKLRDLLHNSLGSERMKSRISR